MKVAVYFEGAGGSTVGLRAAGYETIGYEYWDVAVQTATANGHDSRLHDLSDPTRDDELIDAPVAWFSPPCQPFSAAGDGDGEFDDRDGLPWVLRILERKRYPVVFVENVKGLTFTKHGEYLGRFLLALSDLGYVWEYRVLNCADYGVPQTRERFILVARLDGGRIVWPTPTHTEQAGMFTERWVTMADALGWGGELSYRRGAGMTDRLGPRWPWSIDAIPAPTVHANSAKDWVIANGCNTMKHSRDPQDMVPYERSIHAAAPTVDGKAFGAWTVGPAGHRRPPMSWVHKRPATTAGDPRVMAPGRHDPEQSGSQMADAIRLTIDELATLQGFPPGYRFCGTKTAQAKQIGNAVPPILAQRLAEANRPAALERAA